MIKTIGLSILTILIVGCASSSMMTRDIHEETPVLKESLFGSDQSILDENSIKTILDSHIEIPQKAKLAIIKFPGKQEQARAKFYFGYSYWQTEAYQKSQAIYYETIKNGLDSTKQFGKITILPSLMIPEQPSIPILREAAVRLQADILLIYGVSSNTYSQANFWGKNNVKAYSTCESVVLDVRTGIIPFTFMSTETAEGQKLKTDIDNLDLLRRMEQEATIKSLQKLTVEFASFLQKQN